MSGIWRCRCGELILHGYCQCWNCGTILSEEGRLEEGTLVPSESLATNGEVSRASPEPAESSAQAPSAPVNPKATRWFCAEVGAAALLYFLQGMPASMELFASGLWYVTVFAVTGRIWPLIMVHAAWAILRQT